ncbi:alanine racemase [Vallitalea guaymasensis]|uniref:alanine racemase n=1 Tax=Vallitalea guaymasensis TaxID=1185412 RepID=UPI000DE37F26|nr:alanine racemase [Vallitalea guaymasensis]
MKMKISPFKRNIPNGNEDWKLVKCPSCGSECWESDLARQAMSTGSVVGLCTDCALRKGIRGASNG